MKRLKDLWQNYSRLILLSIIIIISIIFLLDKCNHTNPKVILSIGNTQHTITGKLNDSLYYFTQTALLAQTQAQVHNLESTLQEELFRKVKIGKALTSIEFKDSIVYIKVPGQIDHRYDTVIKERNSDYPLRFTHTNNSLKENYTVFSKDSSSIDSLQIIGQGHLIVGEKGKWFQKKQLTVGLSNENPYFIVDNIKSIVYDPKPKLQVSFGPSLLINPKSTSFGVGVNVKKGLLSFNIGYKIF